MVTALTTSSQSFSLEASEPLPVIAVSAILLSMTLSFGFRVMAISFRIAWAFSAAMRYPWAMTVG